MSNKKSLFAGVALALLALAPGLAAAQALVVNGEEIADAKLFAAAKAEGKLVVYGGRPTESIGPVLEAFKKDTGLQLDYIRLSSAAMYDRVIAEHTAGKLGADYADLSDLSLIKEWISRGVLASYKVPWDDKISKDIKEPNGHWYYIARTIYIIGVNTAEVQAKDYPKSWADTFDPKWKGKLGAQTIESGGSAMTIHAFLRTKLGEDAWKKFAAIEPRIYPNSAPELNDLVRGRLSIAYIDTSSVSAQMAQGAPLTMIFPTEGVPGYGIFGNVTKSAPHPNAARVWMNYLVSKRGSTEMTKSSSYGTHPDAPPPVAAGFTYPTQSQVWAISAEQWDQIREPWAAEWLKLVKKQ
jgi:iron(III) transport system substrate-binding protein